MYGNTSAFKSRKGTGLRVADLIIRWYNTTHLFDHLNENKKVV